LHLAHHTPQRYLDANHMPESVGRPDVGPIVVCSAYLAYYDALISLLGYIDVIFMDVFFCLNMIIIARSVLVFLLGLHSFSKDVMLRHFCGLIYDSLEFAWSSFGTFILFFSCLSHFTECSQFVFVLRPKVFLISILLFVGLLFHHSPRLIFLSILGD